MDVVLTIVESLDAVLANPIILLTRTEERYGWNLELNIHIELERNIRHIIPGLTAETF
jgi:hypothetical protein